jgi:hypothetical protein
VNPRLHISDTEKLCCCLRSELMADLSSLVSSRPVFRASNARKWAMAGAALLCLCAFTAIYQDFRISPVLRSRHALVPDPGLDGPLSPNSATMRNIAPDVYEAQVATSEGIFSIEVKRAWAPHAADRFYNLAANGECPLYGCSIICAWFTQPIFSFHSSICN